MWRFVVVRCFSLFRCRVSLLSIVFRCQDSLFSVVAASLSFVDSLSRVRCFSLSRFRCFSLFFGVFRCRDFVVFRCFSLFFGVFRCFSVSRFVVFRCFSVFFVVAVDLPNRIILGRNLPNIA